MGTPLNQPLLLHSLPLHSLPINPPIAQPTNRLIHQTTNSVNMKFTLAVAASMAATTMANPILGKHWGQKWGHKQEEVAQASPFDFTSTYEVIAVPEQVVDANNTFTGGLKGARGVYKFGLNSKENVICYNITITGFQGEYQSPAISATHIHEAVKGKAGPPRIAFPNPVQVTNCKDTRRSIGCIAEPRMALSPVLSTPPLARTTASASASRRLRRTPPASSLMCTLPRLSLVPSVARLSRSIRLMSIWIDGESIVFGDDGLNE